jgi:hypothetical protein
MLIYTLDTGQKTKVASLNVTQNDAYCTYNVDNIYNSQTVISLPFLGYLIFEYQLYRPAISTLAVTANLS